jgi:hypothetical protein
MVSLSQFMYNRQNDILSFHKEQAHGVNTNVIKWYMDSGLSQQEAYNETDELLKYRYRRWYLALADLPIWGEDVDMQVQKYIEGCKDVVLANLNWS